MEGELENKSDDEYDKETQNVTLTLTKERHGDAVLNEDDSILEHKPVRKGRNQNKKHF